MTSKSNNSELIMLLNSGITSSSTYMMKKDQDLSSPYTPEQTGVVEMKNRTLIEAARTMLSGSFFLKQY
ncbi:retrovirus-related pol polyprotein from transposon TNT 1-94 [Tanacetum coccineum]